MVSLRQLNKRFSQFTAEIVLQGKFCRWPDSPISCRRPRSMERSIVSQVHTVMFPLCRDSTMSMEFKRIHRDMPVQPSSCRNGSGSELNPTLRSLEDRSTVVIVLELGKKLEPPEPLERLLHLHARVYRNGISPSNPSGKWEIPIR